MPTGSRRAVWPTSWCATAPTSASPAATTAGCERALADGAAFVAVLNNDTRVEAGALTRLASVLGERALPAAASPLIRRAADQTIWFAGGVVDHGLPRHLGPAELSRLRRTARPSC